MANTGYTAGYLTVSDAMYLLQAGITLYIVSAPLETRALPLDGAWIDDKKQVHYDCSAVVLNPATAYEIARRYNQQCILRLYPCADGNAEVYLLKDTPFARKTALQYCGGYTADNSYLLVASQRDTAPFESAYEDYTTVEMEFLPVK